MLNDPPPEKKRRPHPLEQQAAEYRQRKLDPFPKAEEPGDGGEGKPRRRVMLSIPVAKTTFTFGLIGINVAIFILAFYIFSPEQQNSLYEWGASNQFYVFEQGEFHRLFTAMFLHGSIAHIAFNMFSLYIIGQTVERFFGNMRFILIYLLGGLCGSVLSALLNDAQSFSVGASGAVFAIVGAELVFLYKHRKLFGQMARQRVRSLAIIIVLNLGAGFANNAITTSVSIDNWGHIGGFLGGVALAWFISPFFLPKPHPTDPNMLTIDDINPLQRHFQTLMLFISAILAVLIVGVMLYG